MCGIYGSTIRYTEEQVKAKLVRTGFRGPDQTGQQRFEASTGQEVIFGHNRLSIIDLDPRSNQPFSYENRVHLVFNGEIYNFKTLKKDLVRRGYRFTTTSDTEVICASYLEYGENCVEHFVGMFAFVLFDSGKQCLFGARDRLGKKPFYYYHSGNDFEFASQISSIQLFNPRLSISSDAIASYLAWSTVPDPNSIFNEIKKLPAGHRFTLDLGNGSFINEPYWDIDYLGKDTYHGSYEEAQEYLEEILTDAVSSRLFADVPVGVFLSGGVDSSLIAALATKTTSEKVKTFSVKFDVESYDESSYATRVASHLKTDHHVIECDQKEGLSLIDNFCHYYDEPFADASAIPSMLLSKYTRQHVTVALSGDGGDESFIGYRRYNIGLSKTLYSFPYQPRKMAGAMLGVLPSYNMQTIAKAIKIKDFSHYYINSLTHINHEWIKSEFDYLNVPEKKYLVNGTRNILERISNFDIKTYLNWDINTKVDRASMAYSLEVRAPLMDHRVVEFARSLPTDFKFQKGNQKRILKDILFQHVPQEIFDRPKSGFGIPFGIWFRNELREYVLEELSETELRKIPNIDIPEVQFMIQQHMDNTWNRGPFIWKLLVLKK
ncbi:MAG TPA: asparagine synthase (glutamine-hydrolyzing), partial [Eudoraea sp.]|nr:asparagine synthase (glutamine-hydrolyzing) [Eudoraea sp.]